MYVEMRDICKITETSGLPTMSALALKRKISRTAWTFRKRKDHTASHDRGA